ncbi:MAG: hypothetical protein LBR81_01695 [Prevotellaceae bacterium]|jgi:hypothetical protein|nr:hypothetical protein [Prevotellaceae bacterium]
MKIKKKTWKVFAQWVIDVSKYLATAVIIATAFRDVSRGLTFILGTIAVVLFLLFGFLLYNKMNEEE